MLSVVLVAGVFDIQETGGAGFTRNCQFALSHPTLSWNIDDALIAARDDLIRVQSNWAIKKALQLYGLFSREKQVFI